MSLQKILTPAIAVTLSLAVSGCASAARSNDPGLAPTSAARPSAPALNPDQKQGDLGPSPAEWTDASKEISKEVASIKEEAANKKSDSTAGQPIEVRIESLENKLAQLNDKIEATRISLENVLAAQQKPKSSAVTPHPTEKYEARVGNFPAPSANDPEGGFVNDDAIQTFRKAMVLFHAQKYPEAVLAFSSFVEKYPDHPMAGSAQHFVGKSYFKQKEFKLALQEYQKVLTSYDRSIHITDTLREMVESEEALRMSDAANKHKQMLTSLFPHSPAAQWQSASLSTPKSETAVKPQTKLDEPPPTAPMVETHQATDSESEDSQD